MQNYIVLEITRNAQGNIGVYPSAKETEEAAWKKYYQILTTAIDSQTPLHSAVIMGADGFLIERKSFTYTPPAPEPEPIPDDGGGMENEPEPEPEPEPDSEPENNGEPEPDEEPGE